MAPGFPQLRSLTSSHSHLEEHPQVLTSPGPLLPKKPSRSQASPGHQPALLHQQGAHTCSWGVAHLPVSTTQDQNPAGKNKSSQPFLGQDHRQGHQSGRVPASAGPKVSQVPPSPASDKESPRPSDANQAGHRRNPRQHWLATSYPCLPPACIHHYFWVPSDSVNKLATRLATPRRKPGSASAKTRTKEVDWVSGVSHTTSPLGQSGGLPQHTVYTR